MRPANHVHPAKSWYFCVPLQALGLVCLAIPDEMETPDILEAYSDCLAPQAPPHLKVRLWYTRSPMAINCTTRNR